MASSSSSSSSSKNNEEEMIVNVLRSMGIQHYDPLVTTALNEYARSYTASLLIDAKEYATYAGREAISGEDMDLAIKMSDERTLGVDPQHDRLQEASAGINDARGRDLVQLMNKSNVLIRYPGTYSQRCYSFLPGTEAFPIEEEANEMNSNGNKNTISGESHTNSMLKRTAQSSIDGTAAGGIDGTKKIKLTAPKERKMLETTQGFDSKDDS